MRTPSPKRNPLQPCNQRGAALAGLLVGFFSLLVTLGLVEVGLRLAGFSYRLYPEKIEFGWPNPNVIEQLYVPDNELLWVQKNYQEKLAALRQDPPDIVFMGDSCTEFGTYHEFFEQQLRANGKAEVSTARLGVGGWSSYQGLRQMRRDVAPLKPKVATVYYGWNDHWIGFGIEDKQIAELRSPLFTLLEHSRLTQLGVKAVLSKRPPRTLLRVEAEDFRENLRGIVRIAREHGIVPMLLTAPSSHRTGKEPQYLRQRHIKDLSQLVPLHQQYVTIVREVATETNAPLCDLAKDFEQFSPEDLVRKYFNKDGIHLTKQPGEGYHKLAEFLYACFERENLFSLFEKTMEKSE